MRHTRFSAHSTDAMYPPYSMRSRQNRDDVLCVESTRPHAYSTRTRTRHCATSGTSRFLLCVCCRPTSRPHAYACKYPRMPRCCMRMSSATGWACPLVLHVSWTQLLHAHTFASKPSMSLARVFLSAAHPVRRPLSPFSRLDAQRRHTTSPGGRLIEPVRRSTISRRCHWRQWEGRRRREAK